MRDVHFVRERERERERETDRETEIDGSDVILVAAEIGDEFCAFLKLALSFALSMPKICTLVSNGFFNYL